MQRRKKAFVFIDHDITIRHFIKSGAFRELEDDFDVTYVFNIDESSNKRWIHTDIQSLGLGRVLTTSIPRARMGSWHRYYAITVLHNQRGTPNFAGRRERFVEIDGKWRTAMHNILGLPGIYALAKRYYLRKQGVYEPLRAFLREHRPDIAIYPSILTGFYLNELLLLTKALDIPFVVLMNSFDNPSQKAVATAHPDKLVVWGEQTKQHAVEYLQIPPEDVLIFGSAQFQVYRHPVAETDDELRAMFGMPRSKPIVLYAGVSKSINETRHLRLIEDAIDRGDIPDCHVLYRPHPWRGRLVEGESNFFDEGFKHITMDPFMEPYYRRVTETPDDAFDMADYGITRKVLELVDGTISTLSTILLETLLLGKPVISFMPAQDMETKYGRSTALGARLAHFQGLWDHPGVTACGSDEALPACMATLLDAAQDDEQRRRIRDDSSYFVLQDGPSYGARLADLAVRMTEKAT